MDCTAYIGRCFGFFLLALVLDVVGLVLFLLGILAPLSFWDFFVLSGPIIIFISLMFWIFWYLGNLNVPYQQLWPEGVDEVKIGKKNEGLGRSRGIKGLSEITSKREKSSTLYFSGPMKSSRFTQRCLPSS
ncbi:LOW QUALITY PROTEIN: transmembrane protein 238-like [Tachysurus vachellii]|uniref:LOW QUALITY PROTEIN: transmembrane protein 238-like n=1 Tax=Tachysurus vachellii TaxID=175792 RepID=UPI00296B06F0|nr:LOW QUALITY PROTEIN: transmembrane protein 238-like [Tachysurus vachellii]